MLYYKKEDVAMKNSYSSAIKHENAAKASFSRFGRENTG